MNVTTDQRYCSIRTMYCLQCGYILNGILSNHCPECGAWFSLSRSETYTTIRKRWYKKCFDILMPIVLTLIGVGLGFFCAMQLLFMLIVFVEGRWPFALLLLAFALFFGLLASGCINTAYED